MGSLLFSSAALFRSPELPSPCRDVTSSPGPPSHRRRFPGGLFLVRSSTTIACLALRQKVSRVDFKRNPRNEPPASFGAGKSCWTFCFYTLPALELTPFFPSGGRRDSPQSWHLTKLGGPLNGRRRRRRPHFRFRVAPSSGRSEACRGGGDGRRSRTTRSLARRRSRHRCLPDFAMPKGGERFSPGETQLLKQAGTTPPIVPGRAPWAS